MKIKRNTFSLDSENPCFFKTRFKTPFSTTLAFPQFDEHIKLNSNYAAIPYELV